MLHRFLELWDNLQLIQRPFPWREFKWNLGIGFGFYLLLVIVDLPWMMDTEDKYMDWLMDIRANSDNIPSLKDKDIPPFVFLDIDNKTFQAWNEPLFTPRERLEYLIRAAATGKARMIVVDIDVSQPTSKTLEKSSLSLEKKLLKDYPQEKLLKDYLEDYVAQCRQTQDKSRCPPIVFARAFSTSEKTEHVLAPRIGFLEEVVTNGAPYLYWGSVHFYQSEDLVVRRWKLWQPACLNNKPQVVPSIELLAMGIFQENCSVEKIQKELDSFKPTNCHDKDSVPELERLQVCGITISTEPRDLNQRIMYSMIWKEESQGETTSRHSVTTETGEDILQVFSAKPFAYEINKNSPVSLEELTGSIVVIGGSYDDGRDIHLTPVGFMPGVLIVINAIHSILQYNVIELLLTWWQNFLLITVLIVIVSFCLTRFCFIIGFSLASLIIIILMFVFVLQWLNYGMWLNFVLPLIVIEIFQTVRELTQECKKPNQPAN